MADFPIIADTSEAVLKKLREALCPEAMQSPEAIQIAAPTDKNGDYQLGVFLYDIREMGEYRSSAKIRNANGTKTFPPKPLSLYYMLFLNSRAQVASGAQAEQRIIGRAIQALSDEPFLDAAAVHVSAYPEDEDAGITFLNLSFEDKTKIWQGLSTPYQVALYFSVSPVLISSRKATPFARVIAAETEIEQLNP